MHVPPFLLERNQTLYENTVDINLTESGVHPATIADMLPDSRIDDLLTLPLGYGYTDGTPSLRAAIADWHPGAGPDNVLVANGTSEANLLTLMTLVEPGDEIIVIVPNFLQIDGLARTFGVNVRPVALRPEDNWQPDIDAVEAAIGPRTRLITLCDPNNPSGIGVSAAHRRALADLAETRGVWLHVDEIYRGAEIDGEVAATSYGLSDRVIVTGGLSKAFGCPGLRVGWLVAPPEIVAKGHQRQDYTTIGTGPLQQMLAEAVLTEPTRSRLLTRGRSILKSGRDRVAGWLRTHNGWSWTPPDASGMAFIAYDFDMPSETLVTRLRQEESVLVCAGSWFGMEGHIRLGFGVDPAHLEAGLAGLERFLAGRA